MFPRSTKEASAAIAEGKGQAMRLRVRQIRQCLAGHVWIVGFITREMGPTKEFPLGDDLVSIAFNKLS